MRPQIRVWCDVAHCSPEGPDIGFSLHLILTFLQLSIDSALAQLIYRSMIDCVGWYTINCLQTIRYIKFHKVRIYQLRSVFNRNRLLLFIQVNSVKLHNKYGALILLFFKNIIIITVLFFFLRYN